jgi:hypothetical protein
VGILGWLLVSAVACGSDDDKTEEEAASDLCTDLDQFRGSFADLVSVDPQTTTVGEFQDAREQVNEDLQDVADSSEDVARFNNDELEAAYDSLGAALDEVDENDTLAEVRGNIEPELDNIAGAWENAVASVPCELPQRGGAE